MSARVRIEPSGIERVVDAGDTIMAAAVRRGLRWPTLCGEQEECGVCALEIVSGGEALTEPGDDEQARLASLPKRPRDPDRVFRLACRLVPADGLVVRKRGVTRLPNGPR